MAIQQKLSLMIPGPTPVPEKVLQALSKHPIGHRSKEFQDLVESTTKNLQWLHQTQNEVLTITGSGTAAMEAGIINTLSKGDKVICGENGKFGERWVKVAKEFGLEVIKIDSEWGTALDPEKFKKILEEAENLSENGVREITLLGQNVNAYNYKNYRLSDLILEIEKLDGIKRIRYTTSHPRDMTEDLINVYGVSKKLMPLVHLPVQSGSDKILKSMNRKHQISDYVNTYEKLQKINPKIKFSSDFIIAYPGEDEKDFNETCDLIKKIEFINSFSFIFSPRPGTTAANFELIDKKISLTRLEKVQKQLFNNQINMNKSLEGKEIDVLVENKIDGGTKFFGRSEYMTSVIFGGNDLDMGNVIKVKINSSNQNTLFGKSLDNSEQRVA